MKRHWECRWHIVLFLVVVILVQVANSTSNVSLCYSNSTCQIETRKILSHCPGMYCGRPMNSDGTVQSAQICTSCPRGTMSDGYACVPCTNRLQPFHIFYLIFMFGTFVLANVVSIEIFSVANIVRRWDDHNALIMNWSSYRLILETCVIIEAIIAAILTVITVSPSFDVYSCPVITFGDWYSVFYNPVDHYCAQERTYPLYSMPFIFYAFSAVMLLLIRVPVTKLLNHWRKKTDDVNSEAVIPRLFVMVTYTPCWLLPIFVVLHFLLAGLVCM